MNKYIEYKDTKVFWLGKIPKHWDVLKIKDVFLSKGGCGFKIKEQGGKIGIPFYKVSDTNNVGNNIYLINANNYIENKSEYSNNIIPKNSIVFPKVGETLRKNKRRILSKDSLIDNNMMAMSIKKAREHYYKYYYYLSTLIDLNIYVNDGAVPSISYSNIANIFLTSPPIKEQKAIADFLDDKVGDITVLIHTIDSQIKNIKEYKEKIIEDVFNIKDCNHKRLKNIISISKGNTNQIVNKNIVGSLPLLSLEYLRGGDVEYTTTKNKDKIANNDDVLIIWDGHAGEILKSKQGILSSTIAKVTPKKNEDITKDYLFYALKSVENQIISLSNGMGIPHVDRNILNNITIPLPNITEQREIAEYLDDKMYNIDSLVNNLKKEKQNLIDYKKVLINDVVTGKIKVYNEELN